MRYQLALAVLELSRSKGSIAMISSQILKLCRRDYASSEMFVRNFQFLRKSKKINKPPFSTSNEKKRKFHVNRPRRLRGCVNCKNMKRVREGGREGGGHGAVGGRMGARMS